MRSPKARSSSSLTEWLLGEASWLLSHAEALADYGRIDESAAELARAAVCEEQVACLLDGEGLELDAAVHRVSAAACYQRLEQSVRAATLLRAALSARLPDDYRTDVERLLTQAQAQGVKELRKERPKPPRRQAPAAS